MDSDKGTPLGTRTRKRRVSLVTPPLSHVPARDAAGAVGALRSEALPLALFGAAGAGIAWALMSGPQSWGLVALIGATVLLDLLAGDVLRVGRRVIAPGLALNVAAFVAFGTPAAAIVGLARGVVRVLTPRPLPLVDSSCIVATSVAGPLLGGLAAAALHQWAPYAWVAPVAYLIAAYTIETGASMLLLARVSRPSLRLSFEQTLGWTMLHFAALGALGVWLGADITAGRWIVLAYFAIPIAVIRHGFDVFNAREERYIATLELENTQLFDKIGQLDRITGDLADALGMAIDCRDGIDQDHSHRVARLATAIGSQFGIAGAELEILRRGALLH